MVRIVELVYCVVQWFTQWFIENYALWTVDCAPWTFPFPTLMLKSHFDFLLPQCYNSFYGRILVYWCVSYLSQTVPSMVPSEETRLVTEKL